MQATNEINREVCFAEPFRSALAEIGFTMPGQLPTGALLGWVELTDVLRMVGHPGVGHVERGQICLGIDNGVPWDKRLTTRERALGLYTPGRYAWITGPTRFVAARPIPHRGGQGLLHLPDAVAELLL